MKSKSLIIELILGYKDSLLGFISLANMQHVLQIISHIHFGIRASLLL